MSDTEIEVGIQPLLLAEPREGVGKVLEGLLNEKSSYHFNQISNLTLDEIAWLDNSMSFPRRITREDLVSQATDLAEGKATEFSQRVERGEVSSSKKS
jgi:hypothetical protein